MIGNIIGINLDNPTTCRKTEKACVKMAQCLRTDRSSHKMNDQNTADELTINERPYIPFSLPHSVRADLTETAEYLRWPVSDLLEAFIETRWQAFTTGKLPAVWRWRSFPTDSLTPEWLSLWRQRY